VNGIELTTSLEGVDWTALKADLAADAFDNGRSPELLERSFASSYASVFAWDRRRCVGTARLLSDGVCNAYLIDVWTGSAYRRRGIASAMVQSLLMLVPGQHVGLFTEEHPDFYRSLGFREERRGMSVVVGEWLQGRAIGPNSPRSSTDAAGDLQRERPGTE